MVVMTDTLVRLLDVEPPFDGGRGRIGTINVSVEVLEKYIGSRTVIKNENTDDGKTLDGSWFIETPRGNVEIYRFWWNPAGEWSIGGNVKKSRKQLLWLRAYLRTLGLGVDGCLQNFSLTT